MAHFAPYGGAQRRPTNRPMSLADIVEEADKIAWNPQIPLKYWIGALEALYREGRNYLQEGNYAKAYLLLLRYSTLYLRHITEHPDAKSAEGRSLLKPIEGRTPFVFDQLEKIKPYIVEAYGEWEKITAEEGKKRGVSQPGPSKHDNHVRRDAALSWNSQVQAEILDAGDYQDLAVDLAAEELQRRDEARRASRHGGLSVEEERQRRSAGIWDGWDREARRPGAGEDDELRRQMEATRRRLDQVDDSGNAQTSPSNDVPISVNYHYPTISKSTPVRYDSGPTRPRRGSASNQPARPPKETLPRPPPRYAPPPPIHTTGEAKQGAAFRPPPEVPSKRETGPTPPPKSPKPEPKKERYTFKPAAYLENGEPVRPVFLPLDLRKDFVRLAAENTRRGVEMCGLLCGTSVNNALFITRLVIPEQICTPDTCETTNEAGTFDFMDKEDLIQLGWIHTHPTQTCFMSSRDLHTQAGYQIMMPESIAIVCAPKHEPSWGIFRLTNPPGLPHLLNCEQTSTFHQHTLPPDDLYIDAEHPPGHVYVTTRMAYGVHDLRAQT